jgi:hypothetical protein
MGGLGAAFFIFGPAEDLQELTGEFILIIGTNHISGDSSHGRSKTP